jgi:hypothetical protein
MLLLGIWKNLLHATSIVTQKMSLAIYAEIFGGRMRTEKDVEYLKGLKNGDKHIDMKHANLPNVVSC